jgi:5-methyltetrahydropteroyltriglutamate--homocysteine methyltransferase
MSATTTPSARRRPFRADHVGSLLRPAELKTARAEHVAGRISDAQLREVENRLIADAIKKQEALGLKSATDGEFRRAYWHYDFLSGLDGVDLFEPEVKLKFSGALLPKMLRVVGKVAWKKPVFVDDFKFVHSHVTTAMAKQTIPSPTVLHFRSGRESIDKTAYPEMDAFWADLGQAYADGVAAFAAAGCRFLQLDEVDIAYLCDPNQLQMLKDRGDNTETLLGTYADLINAGIKDRPADMTIGLHLCRGNFKSSWAASGGYEPVAEVLFNGIDVDTYFMEYDSERAGGFEPLRFLPKGHKTVVLGLVTTKTGELESRDVLIGRIEQAARYAPLEQLAISPQCGFASTEEGNNVTEEQQWAKLRLCLEVAKEVWGDV